MTKTCQIVQHHLASTSADISTNLPSKDALRQVVGREKRKALLSIKEPEKFDFDVNEEAVTTSDGELFLIKSRIFGNKRVMLFSTKSLMTYLGKSEYWIMDGTFKIVPKLFLQLYTIHGPVHNNCDKTFPLLFVLFTNKDKASYDVMFELMIEYCNDNNISLNPNIVLMDFEKAANVSLRQNFELVNAKGCFFHFRQIIYRKVQREGLTTKYNSDHTFNTEVKCILALYYIQPANIAMYFNDLINTMSNDARKIADWFGIKYINGTNKQPPVYSPNFWTQCNDKTIPRTQNSAESFHHHINQICAKRHVGFYRLVGELQSETSANIAAIERIRNGEPLPKKRKAKNEYKLRRIDNILKEITEYTHVELLKAIASNL